MDMFSKLWLMAWFILILMGSAKSYNKGESMSLVVGGFIIAWILTGWIPVAIWNLL